MAENDVRLAVRKMYKLFINGEFVRSESGRSDPVGEGSNLSNVARGSRKDVRDAVTAARAAFAKWSARTPANRGLVLYRLAEMLEGRRAEFVERLRESGLAKRAADDEATATIDRTLWYAGWCDKYAALLSTRNPVAGPHFNFSTPEPTGVVGVIAPDRPALLGLVSCVIPPLVSGNAVVALAGESDPRTAITFAEAVATSDLPAGTLNIVTGLRSELASHLARHMDVNALDVVSTDTALIAELQRLSADNVKRTRVHPSEAAPSLERIEEFVEIKTIWHPAGI